MVKFFDCSAARVFLGIGLLFALQTTAEPGPHNDGKPKGGGGQLPPIGNKGKPAAAPVAPGVPDVCNDLYRYTCADGDFTDPTGTAHGSDKINDRIRAVKEKNQDKFEAKFLATLQNKRNAYFRSQTISALNVIGPPCSSPDKTEQCDKHLARALAKRSLNRVLATPGSLDSFKREMAKIDNTKVRDLDLLYASRAFRTTESALADDVRKELTDEKAADKIKDETFDAVRKKVIAFVQRSVPDEVERAKIVRKLEAVEFDGTDCEEMHEGRPEQASIHSLVIPNAFYNPEDNTFKYCNGLLLQNSSLFHIVQTIAHELAHAFDPCDITIAVGDLAFKYKNPKSAKLAEAEFPFPGILACLRSEESVEAIRLSSKVAAKDDPLLKPIAIPDELPPLVPPKKRKGHDHPIGEDKTNAPGGKEQAKPEKPVEARAADDKEEEDGGEGPLSDRSPFCSERDQINESFADAVAADVLPDFMEEFAEGKGFTADDYKTGYGNVFRGACPEEDLPELEKGSSPRFDVHPPVRMRVNRLLLTKKKIRKQMHCKDEPPAGTKDCEFQKGGAK